MANPPIKPATTPPMGIIISKAPEDGLEDVFAVPVALAPAVFAAVAVPVFVAAVVVPAPAPAPAP